MRRLAPPRRRTRSIGSTLAVTATLFVAVLIGHSPAAGATVPDGEAAGAAAQGGPNRAVVVADSGTGVIVRGIEFSQDSISGIEALRLAGLNPALQGEDGIGVAVCAIQDVGCPPTPDCLTCDRRGYYWSYHRAAPGAAGYTYSNVGAGATRVYDGSVEGWRWGTGAAPPFHSFASVFPPAPTATIAPAGGGNGGGTPGGGSGGGTSGGGPTGGGGSVTPGNGPASADPAATTATTLAGTTTTLGPTTTTSLDADGRSPSGDRAGSDEEAFAAAGSGRDTGSTGGRATVVSLGLLAVVLATIVALIWRSRRRRSTSTAAA